MGIGGYGGYGYGFGLRRLLIFGWQGVFGVARAVVTVMATANPK